MHDLIQEVSTFADVCFKDVSAPLESICYLRGILKKPRWSKQDKNARQKPRKKKKIKIKKQIKKNNKKQTNKQTVRINTDTLCKGSIQQIIK